MLTLKDVEDVLGKPSSETKSGEDSVYSYAAGKDYELRLIISAKTGKVDHISVLSPKDAVIISGIKGPFCPNRKTIRASAFWRDCNPRDGHYEKSALYRVVCVYNRIFL